MCGVCAAALLTRASCAFSKVALQRSSGLDETGTIVWYLALCLLLSWIIVAAALFKGIKSSGKVLWEEQGHDFWPDSALPMSAGPREV